MIVSIKRIKNGEPIELEKRTYLPYVLRSKCPTCGALVEVDLSRDYLSYPKVGVVEDVTFCHENEDGEYWHHEWQEEVVIEINVKRAP